MKILVKSVVVSTSSTKNLLLFSFLSRFPFDWRQPFEYFCVALFQIYVSILACCAYVGNISLFFGLCVFLTTLTTDLEQVYLYALEAKIQMIKGFNVANGKTSLNRTYSSMDSTTKCLQEFIEMHSHARQLSFVLDFERHSMDTIMLTYPSFTDWLWDVRVYVV